MACPEAPGRRRPWFRGLRWAFSLGSMLALSWLVDWAAVGGALAGASLLSLALMYGLAIALRAMEATQMWLLLRWVGVPLSVARVFLANALSAFYALLVPGDLVAAGAKWADLSAASGRRALVLNAILYNRLLMLLPAVLIGSVAVLWLTPPDLVHADPALTAAALLCAAGLLALGSRRVGVWAAVGMAGLAERLPGPARRPLLKLAASMEPFQAMGASRYLALLALSTLVLPMRVAIVGLGAQALGLHIPTAVLVSTMALLIVLRQVPITVGGFGVREGVLIVTLGPYGIPPESAVALGFVMFSSHLVAALIGLGYQIAIGLGWVRWHGPQPR